MCCFIHRNSCFNSNHLITISLCPADDTAAHVHGILTADHLFDGTIATATETYYIEPAARYSTIAASSSVHSVVYKVSDVLHPHTAKPIDPQQQQQQDDDHHHYCASERLHRRTTQREFKRRRKSPSDGDDDSDSKDGENENSEGGRHKRWLPEEVGTNTIYLNQKYCQPKTGMNQIMWLHLIIVEDLIKSTHFRVRYPHRKPGTQSFSE